MSLKEAFDALTNKHGNKRSFLETTGVEELRALTHACPNQQPTSFDISHSSRKTRMLNKLLAFKYNLKIILILTHNKQFSSCMSLRRHKSEHVCLIFVNLIPFIASYKPTSNSQCCSCTLIDNRDG